MKKIKSSFVVVLLLISMAFFASCSNENYVLSFVDEDDVILEEVEVSKNNFGLASERVNSPSKNGYVFVEWDITYDKKTNKFVARPIYKIKEYEDKENEKGSKLNLVNAKQVESIEQLNSLVNYERYYIKATTFDSPTNQVEAMGSAGSGERDYIGTNNQIEDVEEADIIKTDGSNIYYASVSTNKIYAMEIKNNGALEITKTINLDNMQINSLLLTDDYLIVIAYSYYLYDYGPSLNRLFYSYYFQNNGNILIYDRNTLERVYTLETNGYFYEYRLINNALFLVSNQYFNDEDVRPRFKEEHKNKKGLSYLNYNNIYYFDDIPIYNISVFTGINLTTFNRTSTAFLGSINSIYANKDSLYATFYLYKIAEPSLDFRFIYKEYTQIVKFDLDIEEASINYVGSGQVEGYINDSYWMDEYDGYLRIVTTSFNPIINRLYVLEEDEDSDILSVVGLIEEGLGKPNETVKAVRYNNEFAYVVTFEVIDPLYTIDLSLPHKPSIIGAIEEPGYSTYLHVWNEEGNQLIGFGVSTDTSGRTTGLKISAYDNNEDDPLYTYEINQDFGSWYNYSEALYNPKALMISNKQGIIAFPLSGYRYEKINNNYAYTYTSQYLVFFIDFSASQVEDIISSPIVINHPDGDGYYYIDRGIYVKQQGVEIFEIIYTFSNKAMISYDLINNKINQELIF